MLTLLLLGVSLEREAQAFYNPSTGRWLSRDPIGERGGKNLYMFADNRSTIEFDLDGRMSLRETPVQQDSSPTVGDYVGYNGLTWFAAFEPKAKVYKSVEGPCCWKVFLPGYADLVYWWVKNAPGEEPGTTALGHEMKHVEIHRDTYKSFNASASRYVDKCFSKAKAALLEVRNKWPLEGCLACLQSYSEPASRRLGLQHGVPPGGARHGVGSFGITGPCPI